MPRRLAILAALCLACVNAAATELFGQGRWQVPVVLPAEPETEEWYAAQTLLDWCERVTGVRPELISEQAAVARPVRGIFVGRTAAEIRPGSVRHGRLRGAFVVVQVDDGRAHAAWAQVLAHWRKRL